MFRTVNPEKRGRYPLVTLMSTRKYKDLSREELLKEITRLKEQKKVAKGQLDINSINRDLRMVVHFLEKKSK